MRLIDADELLKTYEKETGYTWGAKGILECPKCFIDDAPTIESDIEFAKWVTKMIFDNGVEDFDFELFSELACRKLEKLGLVKKTESRWIKK